MKNKIKIVLIFFLIVLVVFSVDKLIFTNKKEEVPTEKNIQKKNTRALSMMLETGSNTGVYEQTTRSTWPTEGYLFNEELSKCENGGKLSWNDENNTVVMSGSTSDKCYVYFDKVVYLADYVKNQYTGTQGANSLYLHNSSLANGANDGSYRYAGGDYVLTSKATNAGLTTVITADNTSTNGVINFYCNGTKQYVGYGCGSFQTHYYTLQYDSSNTQYETYSAALAKAVTDGYLTKDNVKNFVCFGSDATPCPTANLYRIIGVFGSQVKLIKWDYATSAMLGTNGDFSLQYTSDFYSGEQGESPSSNALYFWNYANQTATYNATSKYNVWSYSQLNTINLNTNYITYLNNQNSKWSQKIAETTWKVGGNTSANIVASAMNTAYQNEIVNPSTDLSEQYRTYSAKIGLMYVSDYGYAASPTYWTYKGYDTVTTDYSAAKSNNWLYGGGWDWTISRISDLSNYAFSVYDSGRVNSSSVNYGGGGVRPVFYLNANVTYSSGDGTSSNPIRVN